MGDFSNLVSICSLGRPCQRRNTPPHVFHWISNLLFRHRHRVSLRFSTLLYFFDGCFYNQLLVHFSLEHTAIIRPRTVTTKFPRKNSPEVLPLFRQEKNETHQIRDKYRLATLGRLTPLLYVQVCRSTELTFLFPSRTLSREFLP